MGSDRPPSWRNLLSGFDVREVAPGRPDAAIDVHRATTEALESAGLEDFCAAAASEGKPLTLVVNDTHRFTDTASFVAAMFAVLDLRLAPGRIPAIRALVAAGSHLSTEAERRGHEAAMFGDHAGRIAEVAWHDARDEAGLVPLGNTTLHRWMAEGGFYLACGSMEPHYFAGVTGAHKTLTVGVMSMQSLTANHEHALSPSARPLKLDGNPVHVGIVDALADLEDSGARLLAVDQVVVDGRVVGVTAGHPLEALVQGLPLVRQCFAAELESAADLVVAQVGPPLDRDFYQADKGIKNTEFAVRSGGVLVLEAACRGGVGIDHFVELLRAAPTADEARAVVEARGYRLGDHKAVRLRALTDERSVSVALVTTGVDPALGEVLGITIVATREEAVAFARERMEAARAPRDGDEAGREGTADLPAAVVVHDAGNVALDVR